MNFRLLILLFYVVFANSAFSQNNIIIFSSNAGLFSAKIEGSTSTDLMQQEVKFTAITKDTLDIIINTKDNLTHKQRLYLLQKARPVSNKEFVYSLELGDNKKLRLVFLSAHDITSLPNPLLPEKPPIDTSYKWHNNTFGTLFELKGGKPIFYYNVPKNGECKTGMSPSDLGHGLAYLGRINTGLEKYNYAKEIVKNNCLTCAQLSAILKTLEYELNKLKLVKDAYPNVIDKTELKSLNSDFRFESSKKEFADMLADPKGMMPSQFKISCTKAESDSVIKQLVYDVKLFASDYERFKFMKEKAYGYCFSSIQFKDILNLFIHDREKLDLTKQFYNNITDKENLMVIKEVFSYTESVVNLESFIKTN